VFAKSTVAEYGTREEYEILLNVFSYLPMRVALLS